MIIITTLFAVLFIYVLTVTLYLMWLSIGAYRFTKKANHSAPPLNIAAVVPAHNEELQVEPTVRGILACDYPKDRLSVCVVADNCTDRTAGNARDAGATVFERTDPVNRGKGQALDWLFRTHAALLDDHDAIAIIDADTVPNRLFFKEISATLSAPGVQAVQGYDGVANITDNWRTALVSAAFNVFNHLRPAGRRQIGGSSGLKGNGMAFRSALFKQYGWPAHSVVEDIEFTILLLLDGILVDYNPDAIAYAEMASDSKQAESQRERWEGGRVDLFRTFAWPITKAFLKHPSVRYVDGFMELFIPPLSVLIMAQVLLLGITALFFPGMIAAAVFCLVGSAFYVVSGLIQRRAPLYVWWCMVAAPFFILWKIPIYLRMFTGKKEKRWIRTKRKSEL